MAANPSRFEIATALAQGWRSFAPNVVPMAAYAAAVLVVNLAISWITRGEAGFFESSLNSLVSFVISQMIAIGWLRIALDIVDNVPVTLDRVRESYGVLVPYLIAAIVFSILATVGFILLVVPGIIVLVVFGFYGWALVDGRSRDAFDALRFSAEITRGERLHLLGFGIVLVLFNLLGLLLLIVGVLVTSAVSILAAAHVYRALAAARAPSV